MRGPATERKRLQFQLRLLAAYDPTFENRAADQASRINEAFFSVDQVLKVLVFTSRQLFIL